MQGNARTAWLDRGNFLLVWSFAADVVAEVSVPRAPERGRADPRRRWMMSRDEGAAYPSSPCQLDGGGSDGGGALDGNQEAGLALMTEGMDGGREVREGHGEV